MRDEHVGRDVQGGARRQTRLEIGAHVVANERRERDDVAAVAGDVADEDGGAAAGQLEGVVEVSPRREARRGPVRRGHPRAADPAGQHRQQRGLQHADVGEQRAALALEAAAAHRLHGHGGTEQQPEESQGAERDPHAERNDFEHADDGPRQL